MTIIPARPQSPFSATPFGAVNSRVIRPCSDVAWSYGTHVLLRSLALQRPGLEYPTGTELWVPFANVLRFGSDAARSPVVASDASTRRRRNSANRSRREPKNEWRGLRATAVPLRSLILGDVRPALLLLTAAAAVLLLAACFNVSNLLLLRGAVRHHEIAIRQALGASHGRIIRLLFVESVPVAVVAGVIGAWVGTELLRVLIILAPANIPRLEEVRL